MVAVAAADSAGVLVVRRCYQGVPELRWAAGHVEWNVAGLEFAEVVNKRFQQTRISLKDGAAGVAWMGDSLLVGLGVFRLKSLGRQNFVLEWAVRLHQDDRSQRRRNLLRPTLYFGGGGGGTKMS